jgi:hypothetical protein
MDNLDDIWSITSKFINQETIKIQKMYVLAK